MKKVIVLLAAAMLYTSLASATTGTAGDDVTIPGFNPTKNVTVDYSSTNTVSGGPINVYSMASNHQSGDREFATTSVYGGIAFKTIDPGTAPTAPATPGSPTDDAIPSGYSQL